MGCVRQVDWYEQSVRSFASVLFHPTVVPQIGLFIAEMPVDKRGFRCVREFVVARTGANTHGTASTI